VPRGSSLRSMLPISSPELPLLNYLLMKYSYDNYG